MFLFPGILIWFLLLLDGSYAWGLRLPDEADEHQVTVSVTYERNGIDENMPSPTIWLLSSEDQCTAYTMDPLFVVGCELQATSTLTI